MILIEKYTKKFKTRSSWISDSLWESVGMGMEKHIAPWRGLGMEKHISPWLGLGTETGKILRSGAGSGEASPTHSLPRWHTSPLTPGVLSHFHVSSIHEPRGPSLKVHLMIFLGIYVWRLHHEDCFFWYHHVAFYHWVFIDLWGSQAPSVWFTISHSYSLGHVC